MTRNFTEKEKLRHEAGMAQLEKIIERLTGMDNEIEIAISNLCLPAEFYEFAWDAEHLVEMSVRMLNRIYAAAEEVEL